MSDVLEQSEGPVPPSSGPAPGRVPSGRERRRRAAGPRSARHRRRRSPLHRIAARLLGAGGPASRGVSGRDRQASDRSARNRSATRPAGEPSGGLGPTLPAGRSPRLGRVALISLAVVVAVALVTALIVLVPDLVRRDVVEGPAMQTAGAPATAVPQTAVLLIRTAEGQTATGVTVLAAGEDGSASATFVPSTTLVEIPGVGLDRLGLAQQYGGAALTEATLENALGIELDGTITVDTPGLGALLQRVGGADIELPERLVDRAADGTGTVVFDAGQQYLNGVRLAEYWSFEQRGETELDTFPRQQRALDALLRALADEELRAGVLDGVPPEVETDLSADELQQLFADLGQAAAEEVLAYQLLPVAPFGSDDGSLGTSYQLRDEEVQALVAERLAGSVPDGGHAGAVAVQVLNGVGVPGIGQQVDERLEGLPFRIVRTDNARSFDFTQTQVVIYEETSALLQAARQVQEALGVGTILVSRQPQSVVDMTVVVGADFIGGGSVVPSGM